jgi:fatty-acyl-CoA synthase
MNPAVRRQTIADALHRTACRLPEKTGHRLRSDPLDLCRVQRPGQPPGGRPAPHRRRRGRQGGRAGAQFARLCRLRFALARRGAVLVPINFMLKAEEVAYILRHAGARTLATDSGLAALARDAARWTRRWTVHLAALGRPERAGRRHAPLRRPGGLHRARCPTWHWSTDLAQIVYTSGTESMPKGAMLTHDAVLWQYVSCVINAEIAEQDRTLHALPLYHCAQLDVFFGPAIYIGSSNVITGKPVPDNLLALLEQHQITSFFAPPTVWIALLRSPLFDADKLATWPRATTAPPSCRWRCSRSWPRACPGCGCGTCMARPKSRRWPPCSRPKTSCASPARAARR